MVTLVPPAVVPLFGLIADTVGAGAMYVNNVLAALLPAGVVTTTLAVPAVPAGVVAVIDVALTTVTPVAAAPPMVTPVAPVKFAPVMVTLEPPAVVPLFGLIADTVGADGVLTVTVTAADVAIAYELSAALVAVTVHVPAEAGAVNVVPEIVHEPVATAYVTAPVPLPPELLNVVVPFILMVAAAGTAVNVA
jgi:hypothetical protein